VITAKAADLLQQSLSAPTCGGVALSCWELYKRDYFETAPTSKVVCEYFGQNGVNVKWDRYVSANFDHIGFAMLALVEVLYTLLYTHYTHCTIHTLYSLYYTHTILWWRWPHWRGG
jgi:hypothetical protein